MVGRIDAAPPEALASPDASRRFVGAITDETLPRIASGTPYTMATRGYIPLGQGTDLLASHELYTDD